MLDGGQGFALAHHRDPGTTGVWSLDDLALERRVTAPASSLLGVVNRDAPSAQGAGDRCTVERDSREKALE
jgi:hypothetical protein